MIAAPVRLEQLLIHSALSGRERSLGAGAAGAAGDGEVTVLRTGMGPRRARRAVPALAAAGGRALLVLGFCGGLDERSVPGEVIVAEQVRAAADEGHDPTPIACADAPALVARLRACGLTVRSGEIACVSRVALGERRAQLLAQGALAVDMESAWLADGAAGRPFAVVRVVLDGPSHELLRPQAPMYTARAGRALGRVARALRRWSPSLAARAGPLAGERSAAGLHGRLRAG